MPLALWLQPGSPTPARVTGTWTGVGDPGYINPPR